MEHKQTMLEQASFPKLLCRLCLPTIVIMLVMVVYNMADTFFIGQSGDPEKIAAISLCTPLFSILSGLGTLFGSGGCTAVSMDFGKNSFGGDYGFGDYLPAGAAQGVRAAWKQESFNGFASFRGRQAF